MEWKPEAELIKREHEEKGFGGRFGAGLPRINDGSLLFLQHTGSKMKDFKEGGTRLAIVFNGSPLFTDAAGSGEREIREGKIQLMDGTNLFKKMRKSLGNKRHEACEDQHDEIARLYGSRFDGEHVRLFDNEDFGYRRITVERSLRLDFAVDKERISRLGQTNAFTQLATSKKRKHSKAAQTGIAEGLNLQKAVLSALDGLAPKGVIKNRDELAGMMKDAFKEARIKVPASLFKAILMALAERDETADICTHAKGPPVTG